MSSAVLPPFMMPCLQGDPVRIDCCLLHPFSGGSEQGPEVSAGSGANSLAFLGLVACSHQQLALDKRGNYGHMRCVTLPT